MKMKLQKSLTDTDWKEIVALGPGVRMYKDKRTFFYNGEKLWDGEVGRPLIYDKEERESWEVIIVLPGVEVIPRFTFFKCWNVKTVIMVDTVKKIEFAAFFDCTSLKFVKLSTNLEYIGEYAFHGCQSLTAMFIPPSCREIGNCAFNGCKKLIILSIPPHTQLGDNVIADTALFEASPLYAGFVYFYSDNSLVNTWVKSINASEGLTLHRFCSSYFPNTDQVYGYVKDHGLQAMKHPNSIGITPSQYLAANPYFEIEEGIFVKRYILEMMGEVVQGQA